MGTTTGRGPRARASAIRPGRPGTWSRLIRGEGGVRHRSPVSPPRSTEQAYAFEHSSPENPAEAPEWLVEKIERKRIPVQPSTNGGDYPDDSIVNRFAGSVSWPELLQADGAAIVDILISRESGEEYERWSRGPFPEEQGYEVKVGATLNYMGTDRLKVFTTNWRTDEFRLEAGRSYSRFGYFCARHFGDEQEQENRNAAAAFLHDMERKAADDDASITFEEVVGGLKEREEGPSHFERLLDWQLVGNDLMSIEPPTPLLSRVVKGDRHDLLLRDSLAVVYGQPASGKSLAVLDMVLSMAQGRSFLNFDTEQCRGIYIMAEGAHGMTMRVGAWFEELGEKIDLDGMVWMPRPINLTDPEWRVAVARWCALHKPGIVVLDTLNRLLMGGDENSSADMGAFLGAADEIKLATGACVVIVHHSGKEEGRGARGHSEPQGGSRYGDHGLQDRTSRLVQGEEAEGWPRPVGLRHDPREDDRLGRPGRSGLGRRSSCRGLQSDHEPGPQPRSCRSGSREASPPHSGRWRANWRSRLSGGPGRI